MSPSLRVLDPDELLHVAGGSMPDSWQYDGNYDPNIIYVTASYYNPWVSSMSYSDFWWIYGSYYQDPSMHYSNYGTGGGGGGGDPAPPCGASNPATITAADGTTYSGLDGAKYYVPEGIDNNYINAAATHLTDIRLNGTPGAIYSELYAMYTNPSHAHFLDFKEYGTNSMPGTTNAGTQTYYSTAAGQYITSSWFEPYGNVIYGYMMTIAGYSPEETSAIAAVLQEGSGIGLPSDAPEDVPHVSLGIAIAQQYIATGQAFSPIDIDSSACGS